MRRRMMILAGLSVVAGLSAAPASASHPMQNASHVHPMDDTDPSTGAWSDKCDFSGQFEAIDPILKRGQAAGATHMHAFFGPARDSSGAPTHVITSYETGDTLRTITNDQATCTDDQSAQWKDSGGVFHSSTDKSAYWAPTLYDTSRTAVTGQSDNSFYRFTPKYALVYFRNERDAAGSISYFPNGDHFAMVGGDGMTMYHQGNRTVQWQCVLGQTQTPNPAPDTIPSQCDFSAAGQNDFRFLRMQITFPSCISGVTAIKDPNGQDSVEYKPTSQSYSNPSVPVNPPGSMPTSGTTSCPSPGHSADTTTIPTIQIGVRWDLTDDKAALDPDHDGIYDLSALRLSSDFMGDPSNPAVWMIGGLTAHADFMSGYTLTDLTGLTHWCVQLEHHCGYV